jgi:tripartite-type tricarboxylate transporter receptor subunit TctC
MTCVTANHPRRAGCNRTPREIGGSAGSARQIAVRPKLNREINTGLSDDPKVRERITGLGSVPMPLSPAAFGKLLIDDTEKWAKVIRAANIKPE